MKPSNPVPTQADDLPPFREITIANVNRLSENSDLQPWTAQIQLTLANLDLLAVISHSLPKPTPTHLNYERWLKWSQLVSKWLILNVEAEFADFLRSIRPRLELADKTYLMIVELLRPDEREIKTEELIKLWSMRRHHFDSIATYVGAWRAQVIICQELELGISWYAAIELMLHELEEEMPNLCDLIDYQIGNRGPASGNITYEEFDHIVDDILVAFYEGNQSTF
ncbi:Amino acid/polyamine transporter I [Penicillium coprophilum]|uniref:Amino acid/polyamine transporter I n=1 Tax=Penicillium coprophilum TaxID=36646 RepID=UPI00238DD2CB|nr:Amino acid/polyamine transporter I [Penicillium coprophilum]KAJ5153945.1 Amino acid/polyamine transporter I [Penicillium coprophilum]